MEIYLKREAVSSSLLKTSVAELETAVNKLYSIDGPMANASYIHPDGYSANLFPPAYSVTASDIARNVSDITEKLGKLGKILNSGPDAISEIDSNQKNQLTNWWGRTTYHIGEFFSSFGTIGFFTGLFTSGVTAGGETIVREDYDGAYKNIVDDFDWQNTMATNEQIEAAVKAGMLKNLGEGEDRYDAIRKELRSLYEETVNNHSAYSQMIEEEMKAVISSDLGITGEKYWSWYYGKTSDRSDSWCAVFTSYLMEKAGIDVNTPSEQNEWFKSYPPDQVKFFESQGCFYKKMMNIRLALET